MTKTDLSFPAFSLQWISQFNSAFAVSFHSTRSVARVRFDSGVIFLDQSQFFATYSNQGDCFILYRYIRQMTFFVFGTVGVGKGRLSDAELTPDKPRAFALRHLHISTTQGQYSSTKSYHCPSHGEHNFKGDPNFNVISCKIFNRSLTIIYTVSKNS